MQIQAILRQQNYVTLNLHVSALQTKYWYKFCCDTTYLILNMHMHEICT